MAKRNFFRRKKKVKKLPEGEKKAISKMIDKSIRRNAELKFITAAIPLDDVTTTLQSICLTDITQSVGDSDRIGDRLTLAGTLDMRLFFSSVANQNVATLYFVRMMLVQLKYVTDSASPLVASEFLSPGVSGVSDYTSQYNHDRRSQYNILYDKTFQYNNNGGAGLAYNEAMIKHFHVKVKLGKSKKVKDTVEYIAANSDVAANHIYFVWMSNTAAGANAPLITGTYKLFYRDM